MQKQKRKKNEQEVKNKLEKEASKKHNYANMTRKEKSYCTHTQGQHTRTHTCTLGFCELQANLIASAKSFVARVEFVKKF